MGVAVQRHVATSRQLPAVSRKVGADLDVWPFRQRRCHLGGGWMFAPGVPAHDLHYGGREKTSCPVPASTREDRHSGVTTALSPPGV